MFKVCEFLASKEIVTLPTNWVIDGKVKFCAKKEKDYILHNRQFYKKWPIYEVKPLDDKSFATYREALLAEEILSNKTDLDTTDVENIAGNELGQTASRKRKCMAWESVTSDPSTDDDDDILPSVPVFRQNAFCLNEINRANAQSCVSQTIIENETSGTVATNISNITDFNYESGNEILTITDATDSECININDIITTKNLQNFRESLFKDFRQIIQQGLAHFFTSSNFNFKSSLNITQSEFEVINGLPLNTTEEIIKLDEKIINGGTFSDELFSFLKRIGGRDVREHTKMLNRLYSLTLQGKINFSGREKKFAMAKLKQMKIIIDVLVQNCGVSEGKEKDEVMYFLQHLNDRIRTSAIRENK